MAAFKDHARALFKAKCRGRVGGGGGSEALSGEIGFRA